MSTRPTVPAGYWIAAAIPFGWLLAFVYAYRQPFPSDDEWLWSLPVAVAGKNGDFSLELLLRVTGGGHRIAFTHLHTFLFGRFLHWRTEIEVFVCSAVALVTFALLFRLFRSYRPSLARYSLIPFSLLTFSLFQQINWISPWQSAWQFANLFLVAALCVVASGRPGWKPLLAAAVLASCATFSRGHGFLVWPSLWVVLWIRGYGWRLLSAWAGLAIAAVGAYFRGSGIQVGQSQDHWREVDVGEPLQLVHQTLAQLGAPMAADSYILAVVVATLGIVLWILDAYGLRAGGKSGNLRESQFVWPGLAIFAIGTAALISASRRGVYPLFLWGGYTTSVNLFWVGLAAVGIATSATLLRSEKRRRWYSTLGYANAVFGAVMVALFLWTGAGVHRQWRIDYDDFTREQGATYWDATSECIRHYPITGDRSCLGKSVDPYITPAGDRVYILASCEFSPFNDWDRVSVLPDTYTPGSPIVVRAPWDGVNAFAQRWMLPAGSRDVTLHLASRRAIERIGCRDQPLDHVWTAPSADLFARVGELAAEVDEAWLLDFHDGQRRRQVLDSMKTLGYEAQEMSPGDPRYREARFRIYRFRKADDAPARRGGGPGD